MGLVDEGAGVVVVDPSGLDGRVLEDLVGRFSKHAWHSGLVQLAFGVCGRNSLALGSSSQVAVAVNGVKVFRDRVLVIVAVQTKFLLRPMGMVDILSERKTELA